MSGGMDEVQLRAINDKYRIFNQLIDREMLEADDGSSFTFSAKDNLCTKEFQARAGSRILEGYRPPFDATPVRKLREAGGLLLGKTNMDEFGFGTFSTNSGFGIPLNPYDTGRACGGSSGGAAAAAALIEEHVALGVSTGGSISAPASFCGVNGLTPTYGRVSRYGLIDYGNSLDKVGLLSRSMADIRRLLPVISGSDPKDPTSCTQPKLDVPRRRSASWPFPTEAMANISPEVGSVFRDALGQDVVGAGPHRRRGQHAFPAVRHACLLYPGNHRGIDQPGEILRNEIRGSGNELYRNTSTTSFPVSGRNVSARRQRGAYCWARSAAWSGSGTSIT